jgi:DNA-directed RNA polymerase subunit RPC12/RpoP
MEFSKTLIGGMLSLRCPRCRSAKLFKNNRTFSFAGMTDMHAHCPNCGLKVEREPNFYYGAMYVSYGLSIAISIANYVILAGVLGGSMVLFLVINALVLLAAMPYTFRLARAMWIGFIVGYDPEKRGE